MRRLQGLFKTSLGGLRCIYLFGEGDLAFLRGLFDLSLLLLLWPLITTHIENIFKARCGTPPEVRAKVFYKVTK